MSAVYTGIKKPESFSHSGFSLKVARQLPLNTPKNPNRKTHLRSVIFWNSAEISLVFCQCKRSLQSRRYYSGFWSRGTWPSAESPDRGPRRNAHYTCTVKGREKSRMRTTYQNTSMRFRFFRACALIFRAKMTPNVMGFSGSVNGTTKNPGFLDFGFCQCKWALWGWIGCPIPFYSIALYTKTWILGCQTISNGVSKRHPDTPLAKVKACVLMQW